VIGAGCADGTVVFVGDDNDAPDTVRVEGNVTDLNPQVAGADLVVFVFTDLVDDGTFQNFKKQRSVAVASDADPIEFAVTQIESGDLTVVFLQDDVGEPDGRIDTGDPIAILDDPDEVLLDVRKGEVIDARDIDIDFTIGVADAESVRSIPRDDGEPDPE
jgi:hypothetical protein